MTFKGEKSFMANIEARIVEDTKAHNGARLTTWELKYPKFLHGELMTHRVFSRNASSSRAVPSAKMLRLVREDPAHPHAWGMEQRGMQARDVFTGEELESAMLLWREAARSAADYADKLKAHGLHKQIVNRVTEAFSHIHTVVTTTETDNFFGLRCDADAQPGMEELSWLMADSFYSSSARRLDLMQPKDPMKRRAVDWHLPYVGLEERSGMDLNDALQASTARCARVSYILHSGDKTSQVEDSKLHNMLFDQKHMSPFEHQGTPLVKRTDQSGNFRGFLQYRATIPNDTRTFNYLLACKAAGRDPAHKKTRWWIKNHDG